MFCVSYFPNSWGIFFLGRDTRLCLIQYEIVSLRNFWMQRREKPLELFVRVYVCERIYRNVNLIWGWRIGFVFSFIIVYYYYVSISLSQKQLLASGASWEKKSKLSFMKYITVIMRFTRVTRRRLYHFGKETQRSKVSSKKFPEKSFSIIIGI